MVEERTYGLGTLCLHAGQDVEPTHRSRAVPIVATTSYVFRSTQHKFMIGTPDAFIMDENRDGAGILEIKTAAQHMRDAWEEGPPPHYLAQVQQYMAVTGCRWGAIAVLFGGNHPGHVDIERDDEFIARMIEAEAEFWERLKNMDPPPADGSESTRRALEYLYPDDSGDTVHLPPEALEWTAEFEEHRDKAKYHSNMKRAAETKVRAQMGSAKIGVLPDGRLWKSATVAETIVPETTRKAYRRFTLGKAKK